MNYQTTINQFINELLEKANLNNLPADYRSKYIDRLQAQIEERLGLAMTKELSSEELKEFEKLIEQKKAQKELLNFLTEKISDFEERAKKVLVDFSVEFLANVQQMRNTTVRS
jgi:uncharacterized protein YdiU (UPF0061 family)